MATRFGSNRLSSGATAGSGGGLGASFVEFFRAPTKVGSAFPASRWLIRSMLSPIDWKKMQLVVEYGPGTGGFTQALLAALPPSARLVAVDTSASFTARLRDRIADPRLQAVHGSASDIASILSDRDMGRVNCILSGLPFSTLRREEAAAFMDSSRAALTDEGQFIAYQMRTAIEPLLRAGFRDVRKGMEWRNLPPCHLYWASHRQRQGS